MSEQAKLQSRINLRVPAELRDAINLTARETGLDVSEILRPGLVAYWPEIDAMARLRVSAPSPEGGSLREFIALCRTAQARGIDPRATLAAALTDHLEANTPA